MKKINIIYIFIFSVMISLPLIFTDFTGGNVAEGENRMLASFPSIVGEDGRYNSEFINQFESWYGDNVGFRKEFISLSGAIQKQLFHNILWSDMKYGENNQIYYVTDSIIVDYQHLNLLSKKQREQLVSSMQMANDYMKEKGIDFYYLQCLDKQTIYPEDFIAGVNQKGEVSRVDQIIDLLKEKTDVQVIDLRQPLKQESKVNRVFDVQGDASHWSQYGAFYSYLLEELELQKQHSFRVIGVDEVTITKDDTNLDCGISVSLKEEYGEGADLSVMGDWYPQNSIAFRYTNDYVKQNYGDTKVLLYGDSYTYEYLLQYYKESFSEVWFLESGHISTLDDVLKMYDPDIVILENAERCMDWQKDTLMQLGDNLAK